MCSMSFIATMAQGHGFQDFTNAEKYREQQAEDAWAKAMNLNKLWLSICAGILQFCPWC